MKYFLINYILIYIPTYCIMYELSICESRLQLVVRLFNDLTTEYVKQPSRFLCPRCSLAVWLAGCVFELSRPLTPLPHCAGSPYILTSTSCFKMGIFKSDLKQKIVILQEMRREILKHYPNEKFEKKINHFEVINYIVTLLY